MVDYQMKRENGDWEIISENPPKAIRANSNDCTMTLSRDGILVRRFTFSRGTIVTGFEELSINMEKKSIGFKTDPEDAMYQVEEFGELFP